MSELRIAKARRALKRNDYRLIKSRVRNPHWNNVGGFMIVDNRNVVAIGSRFECDLQDVETFARGLTA